ncbi:hypothetical protein L0V05_12230 [Tabrizicola sp. J26]|uniref:hypothetical protein n=1 Tax=Alitabrizicola rongguiensis TaxID=2909234 RepID=UPI001F4426BB|nr:hypothetical protein [Tabrizicola rongguiensis]MCF1709583.1 hypothetical protein [Tabrizicola rongguiensis]
MPLRNRVLPNGEIVAVAGRGLFTGNRGILHDAQRQLGRARWRHPHWIICALDYKDVRRRVMSPGTWTELFFLDEAVALAAGHRPCALCRRSAYEAFRDGWQAATGSRASAEAMDRALHAARLGADLRQQSYAADWTSLPSGAFVQLEGASWLLMGDRLRRFTPEGYDATLRRPASGKAEVMTPAPTIAVLQAGYRPALHPSA